MKWLNCGAMHFPLEAYTKKIGKFGGNGLYKLSPGVYFTESKIMTALVQNSQSSKESNRTEIDHLAEFLDINIADLDKLSVQEQVELFKKIVAISQLKLTRLNLRH